MLFIKTPHSEATKGTDTMRIAPVFAVLLSVFAASSANAAPPDPLCHGATVAYRQCVAQYGPEYLTCQTIKAHMEEVCGGSVYTAATVPETMRSEKHEVADDVARKA